MAPRNDFHHPVPPNAPTPSFGLKSYNAAQSAAHQAKVEEYAKSKQLSEQELRRELERKAKALRDKFLVVAKRTINETEKEHDKQIDRLHSQMEREEHAPGSRAFEEAEMQLKGKIKEQWEHVDGVIGKTAENLSEIIEKLPENDNERGQSREHDRSDDRSR